MKEQIERLKEIDLLPAEEAQALGRANALQDGIDLVRINGLGSISLEPEQDRPIRTVTLSGEPERTEKLHPDLLCLR